MKKEGSKDQRIGWLRELKVGDDVFVLESRGVLGTGIDLAKVEKITPTGRINVNGKQFPPNGSIWENFSSTKLAQATSEEINKYNERKMKSSLAWKLKMKLEGMDLETVSVSDLKKVIDILDGSGKKLRRSRNEIS